ncbi:MAG: hypothetical protein IJ751_04475 [Oscillospiraceae bacterium]|nr:hypothetical protein [Oscillospiraceae bacterium]
MWLAETDQYWVPTHNMMEEVIGDFHLPERVTIYDNTLREGEQTPGVVFRTEEKVEIAMTMDDLGVGGIEIFAAVSEDDRAALREIQRRGLKNAKVYSLARCKKSDIDKAAECGVYGVTLEGPSNGWTAEKVLGLKSYDQVVKNFVDAVKYAHSLGLHTSGGGWDSGRATMAQLEYQYKTLADAGIDELHYGDTYGFTNPWTTAYIYRKMREWVGPDIDLATHFHNDFGLATANAMGAVIGGATVVHGTMNGLGERAGNASIDELAVDLELLLGVKTGIDFSKLYPASEKIAAIAKNPVNPNKPITGEREFKTGSGLVLDMWEKVGTTGRGRYACLPFVPEMIGRKGVEICIGKGVGASSVRKLCRDRGYEPNQDQVRAIMARIKEEAHMRKTLIPDYRVDAIVAEVCGAEQ